MILPADLIPKPVHASGFIALNAAARGGYAFTLQRTSNSATLDVNFNGDGSLPLATIDAFRAPEPPIGLGSTKTGIVKVIRRRDQISGVPGFLTDYLSDVTFGPRFADLTIGGNRCMWLEGECQTSNDPATGQVYFMRADNIGALNVKQNAMTIMQVIQLHNSAYSNQVAGGGGRGCVFSLDANNPGIVPHTRIYSEFNDRTNVAQKAGGGYVAEDRTGFRMLSFDAWQETSPVILTYITGPNGTFIGQNEDFRSIPTRPPGTLVGVQAFIGCHEASLPPTDPASSEAMGMSELATMFWDRELTPNQAAAVRSTLYPICGINHLHSSSNAPLICIFTDSVYAGYKADDLRGWDKIAMLQLPSNVRWANWAVPGLGIIHNPASVFYGNSALNWFPGWMAQAIRQHKGRVHCVWGTPLNDYYNASITPDFAYNNGVLKLIQLIRSIDPSAAITLCTGTRNSQAGFDALLDQGSVLIRNGAAANNYNVVEVRNDSVMGIQPPGTGNATYKDGGHLGVAGCERMATLIVPTLQSWLTSLGPIP